MVRFTRKRGPVEPRLTPDGVRATYARLLDGDHLWLALPVGTGTAMLRDLSSGNLLTPANQLGDAEHGMICVRWLLVDGSLPGDSDAEYAVEWAPSSGQARPVLAPPPRPSPTKAPPSPDGRWQFTTRTSQDGRLILQRTRAERRAPLLGIDTVPEGLTVTCREPGPADAFTLLDADGSCVTAVPTSRQDGRITGRISVTECPAATLQVAVTGVSGTLPVTRRHNELRNPTAGVVLPTWTAGGAPSLGTVGLRARFASDATLWIDRTDLSGDGS